MINPRQIDGELLLTNCPSHSLYRQKTHRRALQVRRNSNESSETHSALASSLRSHVGAAWRRNGLSGLRYDDAIALADERLKVLGAADGGATGK
jgi:hypothetical protein